MPRCRWFIIGVVLLTTAPYARAQRPADQPAVAPMGLTSAAPNQENPLSLPVLSATQPAPQHLPKLVGLHLDRLPDPSNWLLANGPDENPRSPIDTLHMSAWEKVFWSRKGLTRQLGLFPLHPDAPVNDLRQIVQVRRRMLSWHQALGLATVASMATTVIAGQRAYSGHGHEFHEATLPFTIGLYSTTAALALLSPPRLIRGDGQWDSVRVHRWLAVLHLSGMILTPLLASDEGSGASLHRTMGYATFATFSGAMIAVTFFR